MSKRIVMVTMTLLTEVEVETDLKLEDSHEAYEELPEIQEIIEDGFGRTIVIGGRSWQLPDGEPPMVSYVSTHRMPR